MVSCGGGSSSPGEGNNTPDEENNEVEAPTKTLTTIGDDNSQDIVSAFADILGSLVIGAGPIEDFIGTKSYSCRTGTFSTDVDILNASATLSFEDCNTNYTTIFNGQIILTNSQLAPRIGFDIEFINLRVVKQAFWPTTSTKVLTANGNVQIILEPGISSSSYTVAITSLEVKNRTEVHSLKDFSMTVTIDSSDNTTISGSGDLSSTLFNDTVEVSTPVSFVRKVTDRSYPNIGQLTFSGADNSYVTIHSNGGKDLTPEDNQTSLDTNGIFVNQSWSELRSWMGLLSVYSR